MKRVFALAAAFLLALGVAANCVLEAPMGDSPIDLGVLSSFAMFTSSGAISADISSAIVGDVGTALGAGGYCRNAHRYLLSSRFNCFCHSSCCHR